MSHAMNQRIEIPEDPTRPMRRTAILDSLNRVKSLLRGVAKTDLSHREIAEEAHLRIERAKSIFNVEHEPIKVKLDDCE